MAADHSTPEGRCPATNAEGHQYGNYARHPGSHTSLIATAFLPSPAPVGGEAKTFLRMGNDPQNRGEPTVFYRGHDGSECYVWWKLLTPEQRVAMGAPAALPTPTSAEGGEARIYTASRAVHGPRWLERRAAGAPIVASWIDEWGEGQTGDWAAHWDRCLLEASTATALVLYAEDGESLVGALAEAGAALRAGVPVFYFGPDACIRKLARHRLLTRCASLDEAFARASAPDADDREAHTEHHGVYLDMPPAVAARAMLAERHPWPVLSTLLRDLLATRDEDRTLPASVRRWPSTDAFYADAEARVRALLTAEARPSPTPAATWEEDDCVCSAESLCALHGVMTGVDGLKARLRALHGRVAELRRQLAEAGKLERQGDGTLPYRVEAYHNPAAAELLHCKPWMIYLHLDAGAVSIPIGAGDTEGDAWRSIPALGSTPAPDHGASTDAGASRRTARR